MKTADRRSHFQRSLAAVAPGWGIGGLVGSGHSGFSPVRHE